jgi:hypothetical protein
LLQASDTDAPAPQRDYGRDRALIEVGQPDERRLMAASARARAVSVIAYANSAPIWWRATKRRQRLKVAVWQSSRRRAGLPHSSSARCAGRSRSRTNTCDQRRRALVEIVALPLRARVKPAPCRPLRCLQAPG